MKKVCLRLIIISFVVANATHAATITKDAEVVMDRDQDGLSDQREFLFGTDPANPDTDGDGYKDGQEIFAAYSPTSTRPIRLLKSIVINLERSQLEQRVAGVPIGVFPISAGVPRMPTPVGEFRVRVKNPRAWSQAARLWMPWWLNFSGRGAPPNRFGIHELPEWPGGKKEGVANLGRPASHGCVRLGIGPAKQLYDWAGIGTPVTVVKR